MSRFSTQTTDSSQPSTWIPQGLPVIRERILQNALVVSSIATAILFFSQFYDLMENRVWPRMIMLATILVLLVTFTMVEKVGYRVRATFFLLTLFVESMYQFATQGMNSDGRLFLLVFVILASMLMETRQGLRVFLGAVLIVIAIRALVLSGVPLPGIDIRREETSLLIEWLNGGVIFVMLGLLSQIANSTLIHHIEEVLAAHQQIRVEIEQKQIQHEQDLKTRTAQLQARVELQVTAGDYITGLFALPTRDEVLDFTARFMEEKLGFGSVLAYMFEVQSGYFSIKNGRGPAAGVLLEQKTHFRLHQPGTPGTVVNPAEPVVVYNLGQDRERFFANDLSRYSLAVLIPAHVSGQLTVIIQAYSEDSSSVSDETLNVYRVLGTQLGYALENCQVKSDYESTSNELNTLKAQAVRKSWRSQLRFGQQVGFRYTDDQIEANVAPSDTASQAIAAGTLKIFEHPGDPPTTSAAIPIIVRDHVLGVLDIHFEGEKVPPDLLNLIEEISNRLALALENARLLEDNQKRAEQEHALGEITAQVRASSDIDGIMKIAAAEIGRALGVNNVLVQLRSER